MLNLLYFTEAILKNRTLTDAKKREQFTILKKQMEMDLMVKYIHVICTNHFRYVKDSDSISGLYDLLVSTCTCKPIMFVLQRRSNAVEAEKKTDKERMEMLMIQEREMTEKEKELEDEAR